MNKLIALVLVLAIATPALADDLIPADFRYDPGSTYSQWTYDDPCGVYDYDVPDVTWFVTDPTKEDPWIDDPCTGSFSGQYWGSDVPDGEPCMPWLGTAYGRDGVVIFAQGSWDFNNFIGVGAKKVWMQITYWNGTETPSDLGFGVGFNGLIPGDPCGEPMGGLEALLSEWPDPCLPIIETWEEYGDVIAVGELELSAWDPCWPAPMWTWDDSLDHMGEKWEDGVLQSSQVLGDGWLHDVYLMELPENPDFEWVEGGWSDVILIDQVVVETLCYVPEPATMVLLGLGSLLMIRRKR